MQKHSVSNDPSPSIIGALSELAGGQPEWSPPRQHSLSVPGSGPPTTDSDNCETNSAASSKSATILTTSITRNATPSGRSKRRGSGAVMATVSSPPLKHQHLTPQRGVASKPQTKGMTSTHTSHRQHAGGLNPPRKVARSVTPQNQKILDGREDDEEFDEDVVDLHHYSIPPTTVGLRSPSGGGTIGLSTELSASTIPMFLRRKNSAAPTTHTSVSSLTNTPRKMSVPTSPSSVSGAGLPASHSSGARRKKTVTVCVRIRPFTQKECREYTGVGLFQGGPEGGDGPAGIFPQPPCNTLRTDTASQPHTITVIPPQSNRGSVASLAANAAASSTQAALHHANSTASLTGGNNNHSNDIMSPNHSGGPRSYPFHRVFPQSSTQKEVYDEVVAPALSDALDGYDGLVFVYGQTGTGKTFTLSHSHEQQQVHDETGAIPRALVSLYQRVEEELGLCDYNIECTYVQIYSENLEDLLSCRPDSAVVMREDNQGGVQLMGCRREPIPTLEDALGTFRRGNAQRAVGDTAMNDRSSRSHCIFTLYITRTPRASVAAAARRRHTRPSSRNNDDEEVDEEDSAVSSLWVETRGRLTFVDLAGSERIKKAAGTYAGTGTGPTPYGSPLHSYASNNALLSHVMSNPSFTNAGGVLSGVNNGLQHSPSSFYGGANTLTASPSAGPTSVLEQQQVQSQRTREATFINKSLLALGRVVHLLTDPHRDSSTHIPFRDSKLTRLLQKELRGGGRTSLIVTVGPSPEHFEETHAAIQFGQRAAQLREHAKVTTTVDWKAMALHYMGLCEQGGADAAVREAIEMERAEHRLKLSQMQSELDRLRSSLGTTGISNGVGILRSGRSRSGSTSTQNTYQALPQLSTVPITGNSFSQQPPQQLPPNSILSTSFSMSSNRGVTMSFSAPTVSTMSRSASRTRSSSCTGRAAQSSRVSVSDPPLVVHCAQCTHRHIRNEENAKKLHSRQRSRSCGEGRNKAPLVEEKTSGNRSRSVSVSDTTASRRGSGGGESPTPQLPSLSVSTPSAPTPSLYEAVQVLSRRLHHVSELLIQTQQQRLVECEETLRIRTQYERLATLHEEYVMMVDETLGNHTCGTLTQVPPSDHQIHQNLTTLHQKLVRRTRALLRVRDHAALGMQAFAWGPIGLALSAEMRQVYHECLDRFRDPPASPQTVPTCVTDGCPDVPSRHSLAHTRPLPLPLRAVLEEGMALFHSEQPDPPQRLVAALQLLYLENEYIRERAVYWHQKACSAERTAKHFKDLLTQSVLFGARTSVVAEPPMDGSRRVHVPTQAEDEDGVEDESSVQ